MSSLVSCPRIPEIELISINKDAVVTIIFGFSAFSKKRIAVDVKKCLQSAIANAENNHNLDVDELIVAEAYVGKNLIMKRGRPRARGRYGRIIKPFSELTIKVRQTEEQA